MISASYISHYCHHAAGPQECHRCNSREQIKVKRKEEDDDDDEKGE